MLNLHDNMVEDISTHIGKDKDSINRLCLMWRSGLPNMKRNLFQTSYLCSILWLLNMDAYLKTGKKIGWSLYLNAKSAFECHLERLPDQYLIVCELSFKIRHQQRALNQNWNGIVGKWKTKLWSFFCGSLHKKELAENNKPRPIWSRFVTT